MFSEILTGKSCITSDEFSRSALTTTGSFLQCFNKYISFADELPNGFHLANYAEQFLDENNHPLDLRSLLEFFNPIVRDSAFLINLLKNGIFCTTMFAVMDVDKTVPNVTLTPMAKDLIKEILTPKYCTTVISSIEQPIERNFLFITKEGPSIKIDMKQMAKKGLLLDLLSPPFLLDKSDSMGRYRKGVFHPKYDSASFGSAIIELRNIRLAERLISRENNIVQAGFLTMPDFLEEEASNVFEALSRLTIKF
ncbi:MAG: hypothetical protein H0U27_01040 [Nitrosopumilus sp.]|nr:hypothetical protein [Nitrosopumilus sp.]